MVLNDALERYKPIMAKAKAIEKREEHGLPLWDERADNQEAYRALMDGVSGEGSAFVRCFLLGKRMLERENGYIDINDGIGNVGEILECLGENGVTRLTLSDSGTSAMGTAWKLKAYGWKVLDLVEINGNHKDFRTGEWEQVPAYLFGIGG